MMACPCSVRLKVDEGAATALSVGDAPATTWSSAEYIPYRVTELPDWEGPYEVTPSDSEQVLEVDGHAMRGNLVVKPIPSNWGRITWGGLVQRRVPGTRRF